MFFTFPSNCRRLSDRKDDNRYFDSALGPQPEQRSGIHRRVRVRWRKFEFASFRTISNQGIGWWVWATSSRSFSVQLTNFLLLAFVNRGTRNSTKENIYEVGELAPGARELPHQRPLRGHERWQKSPQAPRDLVRRALAASNERQDAHSLLGECRQSAAVLARSASSLGEHRSSRHCGFLASIGKKKNFFNFFPS